MLYLYSLNDLSVCWSNVWPKTNFPSSPGSGGHQRVPEGSLRGCCQRQVFEGPVVFFFEEKCHWLDTVLFHDVVPILLRRVPRFKKLFVQIEWIRFADLSVQMFLLLVVVHFDGQDICWTWLILQVFSTWCNQNYWGGRSCSYHTYIYFEVPKHNKRSGWFGRSMGMHQYIRVPVESRLELEGPWGP